MLFRDVKFFDRCVTLELYDFHPVQQGLGYGISAVCRADEQNIRKIIWNVHIVIREGVVLLRIQHFQQCAGRASVIGCGKLVYLIQHHDRV